MSEFIANLIGNDILATIIMSIVPMIELKGGIIFARTTGMDFWLALALAYVGSTIVFLLIFFLLKPILNLMKKIKWFNKFACKIESYFECKAQETIKKQEAKNGKRKMSETLLKQLAVFIFVAIPLPLTGVWTGTAVAVFLDLKFKDVIWPIALGNLVAGLIISALAEIVIAIWTINSIDILNYILYGLFGLALILFTVFLVKVLRQKPTEVKKEETNAQRDKEEN